MAKSETIAEFLRFFDTYFGPGSAFCVGALILFKAYNLG